MKYGIWVTDTLRNTTFKTCWLTEHDPSVGNGNFYSPIPVVRAGKDEVEKMAAEFRKTYSPRFTYEVKEYAE